MKNNEKYVKFKKVWDNPKYNALIKMGVYGVIILIIFIYLGITNAFRDNSTYEIIMNDNNIINTLNNNYAFNYQIDIFDGNNYLNYIYEGKVKDNKAIMNKINNKTITNYYQENDNYYMKDNDNYVLVSRDSVYDVIDYKYLDLANIKTYLKLGKEVNNVIQIDVKDIVLNSRTEDYITIEITSNVININYTNLIKIDNPNIVEFNVKLEFSNIGKIDTNDVEVS